MTAYEVQVLTQGIVLQDQMTTTSSLLVTLMPGSYAFQVKEVPAPGPFGDSPFSEPFGFTVNCQNCDMPTIQLGSANPSTLWPPNGQMVYVAFTGNVTSSCPMSTCKFVLKDSQGPDRQGSVVTQPDGSFEVGVSLSASRSGSDLNGRIYSLVIQAANSAGTTTSDALTVIVPHDQGQ